jgi:hydroxycarboxylate dehydrogenase B
VPRKVDARNVAATAADPVSIRPEALARFIERVFVAAGCPTPEATQIASGLVQANLYGHDSHGVQMAPIYVHNLRLGLVHPGQTPRVVADHGSILGLDGQKGFGQAIGEYAMRMAIDRATAHGCCVLGLSNTHHLGRIGQWAEQCAQAGMVSVHFVNVLSTPLVAPWGGSDARLATNPFCVGVPREPEPVILDYATSRVALGKVRVAHDAGTPVGPGVLLDSAGLPTEDPAVMFADPPGALLPFGEHKGFALAVMCELLGGALSGGSVQHAHPGVNPMINNMLSLVFVPDKLVSRVDLARQVLRLEAWIKASPVRAGGSGIHLPGQPERSTARERERDGIRLPSRTREALVASARTLGIATHEYALLEPAP